MLLDIGEYSELVGLGVLILGTGLAFGARIAIRRLGGGDTDAVGTRARATRLLAPLAFWTVLVGTAVVALGVLGIGQTTRFLDAALAYMPRVFAALLILIGGHLLGIALRGLMRRRLAAVPFPPRAAYWLASGPAVIAAAQQLGIEVSFVANLVARQSG